MRYVLPILAVLALVAVLVFIKSSQIGLLIKSGKAAEAAGPPPEMVASAVATDDTWEATIAAVGSVEAVRGVTLSNEAAGVVTAVRFESGAVVNKGDVLVELDTSVERAQLASVLARRELAATNLKRTRALVETGTAAGSQLDTDQATHKSTEADAAALQAQIARKTVRAPFGGKLGIRQVNLGQYLNPGTPITVLEAADADYVDFTLPQQRLGDVAVGTLVRFALGGTEGTIAGVVAAIDPTVDPVTRSIRVRATAADKAHGLRPGMFVSVAVVLPAKRRVVAVPATAVVHAPYGNSVFVIEDKSGNDGKPTKVARQQFVRTGETRGDFVDIEDGVKAGQEIVVAGAFKLRNGARVAVDNTVKPNPQLNPRPENR